MKYLPNQYGKVLEEMLAGSNSDPAKTTLSCLCYFKMTLLFFQVLQKSLPISLSLCHIQYRVLQIALKVKALLRIALKVKASHSNW